jgi:hypothetical protein
MLLDNSKQVAAVQTACAEIFGLREFQRWNQTSRLLYKETVCTANVICERTVTLLIMRRCGYTCTIHLFFDTKWLYMHHTPVLWYKMVIHAPSTCSLIQNGYTCTIHLLFDTKWLYMHHPPALWDKMFIHAPSTCSLRQNVYTFTIHLFFDTKMVTRAPSTCSLRQSGYYVHLL